MKIHYGDVFDSWDEKSPLFITTNSFIKKDFSLVMGKGIAKTVRDRYVGIDLDLGLQIEHLHKYGLVQSSDNFPNIWAFQVKYHFKSDADLDLIRYSTELLCNFAKEYKKEISLNYPGIGNGRRTEEEVSSIISCLPDNVNVWRL